MFFAEDLGPDFYPGCAFKCVLKLSSKETLSHWLHLFDFSPLCIKGSDVAKIEPDASCLQREETLGPISLLRSQMSNVDILDLTLN